MKENKINLLESFLLAGLKGISQKKKKQIGEVPRKSTFVCIPGEANIFLPIPHFP